MKNSIPSGIRRIVSLDTYFFQENLMCQSFEIRPIWERRSRWCRRDFFMNINEIFINSLKILVCYKLRIEIWNKKNRQKVKSLQQFVRKISIFEAEKKLLKLIIAFLLDSFCMVGFLGKYANHKFAFFILIECGWNDYVSSWW